MLTKERMTGCVHTCRGDETLERAAQLLWEHDCGCLPVVGEHGHLHGMITDRDICMAAYTTGLKLADLQVREAMAIDVASIRPGDTLRQAEILMRERGVRRLPVLDSEDRVIGILSCNDLARWVDDGATTDRGHHDAVHLVRTFATVGRSRTAVPAAAPTRSVSPAPLVIEPAMPLPAFTTQDSLRRSMTAAVAARRE